MVKAFCLLFYARFLVKNLLLYEGKVSGALPFYCDG